MACLCHKLRSGQYHNITSPEADILSRTLKEAPQLFQINPPSPTRRKRSSPQQVSGIKKPSRCHTSDSSLVNTYPNHAALRILTEKNHELVVIGERSSVLVRIFLTAEQNDHHIEAQQLLRRICSFVFTQLHQKGTSIDPLVREIEHALPSVSDTKQKIYRLLQTGSKWVTLVEEFSSIVNRPHHQLKGLLCVLGSPSSWERARPEHSRSALTTLAAATDILDQTLKFGRLVGNILDRISAQHSFLHETPRLALPSNVAIPPTHQALYSVSEADELWVAATLAAVSSASHRPDETCLSEDSSILLALLSFFPHSVDLPLALLTRGSSSRKRWNLQGEIEDAGVARVGLATRVERILSDTAQLRSSLQELSLHSDILARPDDVFRVTEDVWDRVHKSLPADLHRFWKTQALLVAYRSIPWKFLEPAHGVSTCIPQLRFVIEAGTAVLEDLPTSTRFDIALTLLEGVRFPSMAWKRFAVGQANVVSNGLRDDYLGLHSAASQALLSRITGNLEQACSHVSNTGQNEPLSGTDRRLHAAIGQIAVQRALNCMQADDVSGAIKALEAWDPIDQTPSSMEKAALFRKNMILGRVLRYQGQFQRALGYLEAAWRTVELSQGLVFDEDLSDLVCDIADTLRELDNPGAAENRLRTEMSRRKESGASSSPGADPLLQLSLAESLFAQGRLQEAETLCLEIQSTTTLLKMAKVRLYITLAKIRHVTSDYDHALEHWSAAMSAVSRFPLTGGRATRIIVLSICDILSRMGQTSLVDQSLKQVDTLGTGEGGASHWIPGLERWLEVLRPGKARSHI